MKIGLIPINHDGPDHAPDYRCTHNASASQVTQRGARCDVRPVLMQWAESLSRGMPELPSLEIG